MAEPKADARAQLTAIVGGIIGKNPDCGLTVEQVVTEAERAMERAARPQIPRVKLKQHAEKLAKASAHLIRALAPLKRDPKLANELYWMMQHVRAYSSGEGFGTPPKNGDVEAGKPVPIPSARIEATEFRGKTGIIFDNLPAIVAGLQALESAAWLLIAGKNQVAAPVLAREGKPQNEARFELGLRLAHLFTSFAGEAPTYTGKATIEKPGTDFGRFVALAAEMNPIVRATIRHGFSDFLQGACATVRVEDGVIKIVGR